MTTIHIIRQTPPTTLLTTDKPYLYLNLPAIGDLIEFEGLQGPEKTRVTAFKHVATPDHDPFNHWGVMVELEDSGLPAYINDYRVIRICMPLEAL